MSPACEHKSYCVIHSICIYFSPYHLMREVLFQLDSPGYSASANEQHQTQSTTLNNQQFILNAIPYAGAKHNLNEAIFLLLTEKSICCIKSIFKLHSDSCDSPFSNLILLFVQKHFTKPDELKENCSDFPPMSTSQSNDNFAMFFRSLYQLERKSFQNENFFTSLFAQSLALCSAREGKKGCKRFLVNEFLQFYESKADISTLAC